MGLFDLFKPNVEKLEAKQDVEGLINALRHKDEHVQRKAAKALGKIGDKRAVEPLIQALKDEDRYVRAEVAEALENINSNEAREALVAYQAKEIQRRRSALINYVVGRHLVKQGYYKKNIGAAKVGYFDPTNVIFRLFDNNGRRLTTIMGVEATGLSWPPICSSEQDQDQIDFIIKATTLTQALETSNPLGEVGKLLTNLERVADGEVDKFIFESTVLPFFERYSAGEKTLMIHEVVTEVRLNSLFNFLCSEVVRPAVEDIGVEKLKRRAIARVRQLKGVENKK